MLGRVQLSFSMYAPLHGEQCNVYTYYSFISTSKVINQIKRSIQRKMPKRGAACSLFMRARVPASPLRVDVKLGLGTRGALPDPPRRTRTFHILSLLSVYCIFKHHAQRAALSPFLICFNQFSVRHNKVQFKLLLSQPPLLVTQLRTCSMGSSKV